LRPASRMVPWAAHRLVLGCGSSTIISFPSTGLDIYETIAVGTVCDGTGVKYRLQDHFDAISLSIWTNVARYSMVGRLSYAPRDAGDAFVCFTDA
jgi:hypothetical protein